MFCRHPLVMSISNLPSSTNSLEKIRFPKRHHRQTHWQVLGVIALGLVMVSTNLEAEETFDVDWSTLGSLVPEQSDPDSRIAFVSKLSSHSIVAGLETKPPNPFPGSEASLYVTAENPDDTWFRFVARPFVEQSAAQGAMEFEFSLVTGAINFSLGHCDQPWTPGNLSTYSVTHMKFLVVFAVDQEVQIAGRSYQTGSISTLSAGENYRFLIKWDMATPERFAYFLNGEPLTPLTGSAHNFSGTSADTGIDAFRIAIGGPEDHLGSFFLGRISARSVPVDFLNPEGLLEK